MNELTTPHKLAAKPVSFVSVSDNKDSLSSEMEAITEVRDPLSERPRQLIKTREWGLNNLLTAWHWSHVGDLDNIALFPSAHEGQYLILAREVYHKLCARLLSGRIASYQTSLIVMSFLIAFVCLLFQGGGVSFLAYGSYLQGIGGGFGVGVVLAVLFFFAGIPYITRFLFTEDIQEEVRGIVQRSFLRELPDNTPEDLADIYVDGWLTADGRPISSELSAEDGKALDAYGRTKWWIWSSVAVGLTFMALFGSALLPSIVLLFITWYKLWRDQHPLAMRAAELSAAESVEGVAYAAAGGKSWALIAENARQAQIKEAIRDTTPKLKLGVANGVFGKRGDFFAPNQDKSVEVSIRDLQQHLLVLGGTGSGKTSAVLRPLARRLGNLTKHGMVVMDGKGSLPRELSGIPEMKHIEPLKHIVSLIAGLEPAVIVDTIIRILVPKNSSENSFFIENARGLLRRAAVIVQAAWPKEYTLSSISNVATNDDIRGQALDKLKKLKINTPVLDEAVDYFKYEWAALDQKTKSNILATATGWIGTITATPELLAWAQAKPEEDTVDLMSPLKGGRIAINLPEYKYGKAGAVVSALLKARIYNGIKARADGGLSEGETPVTFIIDEAARITTAEDAEMLAMGRSLQLSIIAATQGVEGIYSQLGDSAEEYLSIFGSIIALPGRSAKTDEFIAARAGEVWQSKTTQVQGTSVKGTLTASAVSGPHAAAVHQNSMSRVLGQQKVNALQSKTAFLANQGSSQPKERPTSTLGAAPLISAGEINSLLAVPNTALAFITRARVPRRDVILMTPEFPEENNAAGGKGGHSHGES